MLNGIAAAWFFYNYFLKNKKSKGSAIPDMNMRLMEK